MDTSNLLSYLSEFLSEYPLYSLFGTDQPLEAVDLDNLQFNFFCQNENRNRIFKLRATSYNILHKRGNHLASINDRPAGFTEMYSGNCQSCEAYTIYITLNAGTQTEKPKYFIRKIGQYPAPAPMELKLPKPILHFLNDADREFYQKALQCLESEQGTGALAYFRRIIENEMKRVIETMSAQDLSGSKMIHEALSFYKEARQRSKFIEDIKSYLLQGLKEHGPNILLLMYDTLLTDINELEEEECLKKSKDIDTLFRYLARKINEEKQVPGIK
jgi:hypothetical protein